MTRDRQRQDGARRVAQAVLVLVSMLALAAVLLALADIACGTAEAVPPGRVAPGALVSILAWCQIALAFAGIKLVHALDTRGDGLRGRYRQHAGLNDQRQVAESGGQRLRTDFLDLDKGVVSAFITKQSIFAALALGLLAALGQLHDTAVGSAPVDGVYYLALGCLLISLVTVLVSIECYSSVLRYHWPTEDRVDLLLKARGLDAWSFYLLVLGLLLGVSVGYPVIAALLTAAFTGLLVRRFYFRHPGRSPAPSDGH